MSKARLSTDYTLMWHCLGCGCGHGVPVKGERAWGWNGSFDSPTLTPSVLVYPHDATHPFKPQVRCHCFIKDGRIEYLPDCGHILAGQTVEMEGDA
jgi:hypothetical protein